MQAAPPIQLWPETSVDPTKNLTAAANETSADTAYLRHQFVTWSGWLEPRKGWTPPEAREAIEFHLKGWPYMAASLARHLPRFALIMGALVQRTAPPLRTQWRHEQSRGPKYAVDDLDHIWSRQFRPGYEEKLRDMALLGGSVLHVHWVPDVEAGVERPVLKRWPHEAMFWRSASPAFPGGWYAITSDSGLVRMTPGDGHWIFLAHGERWHELGSLLALGELFVAGKLAERDEAGLSEVAGRAAPVATLPEGVKVSDEIGQAVVAAVAALGRARQGAVKPFGTQLDAFEIASDTAFWDRYGGRTLLKVALSILGQSATLSPGANGVYQPIVSWSVADALADKDHEATTRGWDEGLVRPYREINGITTDAHLVGERYADANAKAKAVAERATLHAAVVKAWRDAGLRPSQGDVDDLAAQLSTPTIEIGEDEEGDGDGEEAQEDEAPPKEVADAIAAVEAALGELEAHYERDPDGGPPAEEEEPAAEPAAATAGGLPKRDEKGRFAATGRSKAAAEARRHTKGALGLSKSAKDAVGHADAAKAHREAAAHHEAAAKASRSATHQAAHARVAEEHRKAAAAHDKAAASPVPTKIPVKTVTIDPGLPLDAAAKMTSGIKDRRALAILKKNPIQEIHVGGAIAGFSTAYGICTPNGAIEVNHDLHGVGGVGLANWNPAARRPLAPKEWSTTEVASTPDEMRATTFVHETAHHIHFVSWSKTESITEKAYAAMLLVPRGAVTKYAEKNHQEYFAESFALYNHSRAKLKAADPIGYRMVNDVLKAAKKP